MPVTWSNQQYLKAQEAVTHLPDTDPRKEILNRGISEFDSSQAGPPTKAEFDAQQGIGRLPETDAEVNLVAQADSAAKLEGQKAAMAARDIDESLPSASKKKSLFAPNEFHPPPSSLGGPLDTLRHFLPSGLGGSTEMYREPTLAEFRMATGNRTAERDSDEYKHFADTQWKARVERAQREGTPVVRTEYMDTPTAASKLKQTFYNVAHEGPDTVMAGLLGAGDLASGGLLTKNAPKVLERQGLAPEGSSHVFEDVMADSPVASSLGALAGAAKGIPGKLGAAVKGLGGVAQGAVAAGGTKLAENVAKSLPEGLGGEPGFHPSVDSLVLDPLIASGIGAGIGGIGSLAGSSQGSLRKGTVAPEQKAAIRALDRANAGQENFAGTVGDRGGLNPFSLFGDTARLTPAMKENFAAEIAPGSTTNAPTEAVRRVAPKLAESLGAKHQALSDAWDNTVAGYMNGPGRDALVRPTSLVSGLSGIVKSHQYEGTDAPLPFVKILGAAKSALNRATDISEPAVSITKDGIPGEVMTVGQAKIAGYDVNGDPALKVKITPKAMNAQEFENMMSELRLAANEGKDIGPETYRQWAAQAREDRDKFPGGWSEKHTKFHDALSEIEGQIRNLGMQPKRTLDPGEVAKGMGSAVGNYRGEGSIPDKVLEQLAGGDPTVLQRLREVAAHDAVPKVNAAGKILSTNPIRNLSGIRVSLDPLAGLIDRNAPDVAVAASSGKLGPGAKKTGKTAVSLAGPALNAGFLTLKDIANYVSKDDRTPQ